MDSSILTLINQGWTHPWLDGVMMALTTVGLALVGLMTLVSLRRQERPLGWALLLAQVAALIGVLVFYWLAARTRPDAARLIMAAPPLPSFPSGHAALAAATVTVWWLHHGWNRRTAAVVVLAVGVAYSRVYLGHHFPTDVVAGIVWGLGMGAAAHGITHYGGNRRVMVSWLLWPQVSLALMVTFMAYLGLLPLYLLTWPFADKVLHMILIGALAFWLNLWLPDRQLQMGRVRLPVAIVLPFALAAVEELMQSWSPIRTFDLGDLASDLVGLLLFYTLSRWVMARMLSPVVAVRERF
jgi:undecaprenyl-diphosphatase